MAEESKKTYPSIPIKHWWALRDKFKQSIPASVTPGYIATTLGMQERSAKANIIPYLVMLGLIDQDGKPTERAVNWRDDEHYPEVCKQIRQELYPRELLDAIPGPSVDRDAVERWFANKLGVGEVAAKRMARVYELLSEAVPSKRVSKERKVRQPTVSRVIKPRPVAAEDFVSQEQLASATQLAPSLNFNIQVHISPDASADQIDQIFASIAKHLQKLR